MISKGALLVSNNKGFLPFTSSIYNWIDEVHQSFREDAYYFDYRNEMRETQLPNIVYVDQLAEFSLKYISEIVTRLENSTIDIERFDSLARIHSPAEQFISHVSLIPMLLKTCLLMNKDKLRQQIFKQSYMKRCLLMSHFVGDWLVILVANSDTSTRAIEYFESLSKLNPTGLGIEQYHFTDIAQFNEKRENILLKISKMDYILPALFMLSVSDMKRACSCYAVRRILELSMTDPSLLGLLSIDLSMHLILIIAYDGKCVKYLSILFNFLILQ